MVRIEYAAKKKKPSKYHPVEALQSIKLRARRLATFSRTSKGYKGTFKAGCSALRKQSYAESACGPTRDSTTSKFLLVLLPAALLSPLSLLFFIQA